MIDIIFDEKNIVEQIGKKKDKTEAKREIRTRSDKRMTIVTPFLKIECFAEIIVDYKVLAK